MKLDIEFTDDAANQNLKALLVGFSGAGKTYAASRLPGRTLVISAEGGLLSLKPFKIASIDITTKLRTDAKGNAVIGEDGKPVRDPLDYPQRIEKLGSILKMLREKKEYDNIFLDSITEIAECVVACVQKEFPDRKDSLPMWGEYAKRMKSIVKSFRDLPGYNVFMTCLAEYDKDENNRRFIGCDVVGKAGRQLPQFFDEVFYVYRNAEGQHRFFTKKIDTNVSKDRSGKLDEDMPADLGIAMIKIFEKEKK